MNILNTIRKNKNSYLIIIAVLAIMVIFQAYLLLEPKAGITKQEITDAIDDQTESFSLLERLREKFKKDRDTTDGIFDDFFDDDFFTQNDDPFKELQELRKRMSESFKRNGLDLFNHSWDSWHDNKFGLTDMDMATEDKGDKIIMTFKIPGLKSNTLNVDINDKRIKLECDINETVEEKNQDGNTLFQSKRHRRISKILPVPENADANQANVETKGDKLVITFPKIDVSF